MKVLITGATGNVGLSVINAISHKSNNIEIYAGVRNILADSHKLKDYNVSLVTFDFENTQTFKPALQGIDIMFLLRPPQLADVHRYFNPLIDEAGRSNIKLIIFLSVQGVENSKIIPHHKIEKLITNSKIEFTFLRPAYFMQNFTTTLLADLVKKHRIYLPAGQAKFTLIDVDDIGAVTAKILSEPKQHFSKCYELTNGEILTFSEMAEKISMGTGKLIKFISPNLLRFYLTKRKENVSSMYIFVLIMLHYFPRFEKTQRITQCVKNLTGKEPKSFDEFVQSNIRLIF